MGIHLGVWGVHSLTLSYTPENMKCDFRFHSWPAPSQALALVMSPRLGLRHQKYKITKERVVVRSLTCGILRVEGMLELWDGDEDEWQACQMNLHKPNKFVSTWLEHFWCINKPRAYMNSQDSPRSKLGGNHHLPLIIFSMPGHGAYTQMSFCPETLKLGILKFLKLGLP